MLNLYEALTGKFSFSFPLQSILNAANKLVFMITENQYKSGPDGSIPVLVNSVRSDIHCLF